MAYSHPRVFRREDRIVAGVPESDPALFESLVECLEPPYHLLYVLHTPRGEAEPGRYQSPLVPLARVKELLAEYGAFFSADGRFDLWAHSPSEDATVVWGRHDLLYAYGPLDRYASRLVSLGFASGHPEIPRPHQHHYRAAFDPMARKLLTELEWSFSPLREEDEQRPAKRWETPTTEEES